MTAISKIRNIAIIGAGPAGLAAAKYLLAEKSFDKIDVFEQRSTPGGTWNYSPGTDKIGATTPVPQLDPRQPVEEPIWHQKRNGKEGKEATFISPLYERLETNIPKDLMQFSDKPFPADSQLFPTHRTVTEYLNEYADDIRELIHFETQVLDVTTGPGNSWILTRKELQNGRVETDPYDAVVVASGHYNVPYVPAIEGIEEWNLAYPGVISHSKFYDSPEAFKGKKVIVVGNSASGIDIGTQIASVCKGPLLASSRSESYLSPGPAADRIEYPEIVEFLSPSAHERAVRFKDGRIESEIDAILFCTGYLYSFPFLSSLQPPVIQDGSRTLNIYQQLFYIENPTLVFPILPQKVIPFPLSENQAAVFSRVFSGRLTLPSKAEMKAWEESVVAEKGDGKAFHVLPFPKDAEYLNFLYDWARKARTESELGNEGKGKLGTRWGEKEMWMRERFPEIKKAFQSKGEERHSIRTLEEIGFDFDAWKKEHENNGP
ncbi:hypothetical protein DTO271G3_3646 [Paecilomyces variotii]|nr:hypothetical protein DTO271G3_3646 [Paecilomyces variotii]